MIDDLQTPKHKTNHIKYRRCFPQYLFQTTVTRVPETKRKPCHENKPLIIKIFYSVHHILASHYGKELPKMKKTFITLVPLQTSIFAEKSVRKKKTKPCYGQVMITGIGSEGKSLAKVGDKVVFTDHAIPGDVVDLQVTVSKKRYEEARVVRYHAYSPNRTEPFCRHFGLCGGCKWQFLPYELQLSYKQQQVQDQLERIGKMELPPLLPILGSEETRFYRNKLEFSFSDNRWLSKDELETGEPVSSRDALGFHVPGMFDKIFQVNECWLQPEPSNKIRNFLYDYAISEKLEFYNIKNRGGFLRSVIIRTSTTGAVMVILSFFREERGVQEKLLKRLIEEFPEITSLFYVINPKGNDTITDLEPVLFHGDDHITEEMEGLRFRIGPKSFSRPTAGRHCTSTER